MLLAVSMIKRYDTIADVSVKYTTRICKAA